MTPRGLHHVSSLSADIQASRDFFVRVLGLRPLITTVNQDDPTMYHLFFGDGAGSPGSEMTVFDMPRALPEHRGNNSISRTCFRISGELALQYWIERLGQLGVPHRGLDKRDGRGVLDFDDPVGTRLSLVVDETAPADGHPWPESPVPPEHQIRGLGYTTITVPVLDVTEEFLVAALGMQRDRTYEENVHVFRMGAGGAQAEVHVVVAPELKRARYGSGGVHHVALCVPDAQPMDDWVEHLAQRGYPNSGIVDRHYFTSIYVREPNGILFELATEGPGFEVAGPIDPDKLSLPPFLEPQRAEIEAALEPLQ